MEPGVLCSEDRVNPAVCACFCRFPLPTLCNNCVSKHQVDSNNCQHFHLPVFASQRISTKTDHVKYSPWLSTLRIAQRIVKENLSAMDRFEEQLEAARLEALSLLDQSVLETMRRFHIMKAAFQTEMQRAISETSMHALDEWSPDSGSLSSRIWNSNLSDSANLKFFRLWAGVGAVSQAVQVNIETTLPALAAFNQSFDGQHMSRLDGRPWKTLQEVIKTNEEVTAQNEALKREVSHLRGKHSQLTEALIRFEKSSTVQIQNLSEEVAALKQRQGSLQRFLPVDENDLRKVATSLLEKGIAEKAAFRYSESAQWLQDSWYLLKGFEDKQTAVVGAVLGEVLGVHLGKCAEASKVLAKSIEIEVLRNPTSEDVMKLNNLNATINILHGNDAETEAICWSTLQTFTPMKYSSELFWVTIFNLTHALCELRKGAQAETVIAEWVPKTMTTRFTQLLKLSAKGILQFQKERNKEAEDLLLAAQKIAANEFATSIYAALISFWLGRVHATALQIKKAKEKHSEAEVIFSNHFPACIWAALNLSWLSDLCNDLGQRKVAVQKSLEAHHIFQEHFPLHINTANNLVDLASLYKDMNQRELEMQTRLEAHRIYEAYFPTDINTAINLNCLGLLYWQMGRLEEAGRTYEQARSLYSVHHSTSDDAAINLYNLALFYEQHNIECAIRYATSAFEVWRKNNSVDAEKDALPLLTRLKAKKLKLEE